MNNFESNIQMDEKPFSYRMTLHQIWEDLDKLYGKPVQVQDENVQIHEEYIATK